MLTIDLLLCQSASFARCCHEFRDLTSSGPSSADDIGPAAVQLEGVLARPFLDLPLEASALFTASSTNFAKAGAPSNTTSSFDVALSWSVGGTVTAAHCVAADKISKKTLAGIGGRKGGATRSSSEASGVVIGGIPCRAADFTALDGHRAEGE